MPWRAGRWAWAVVVCCSCAAQDQVNTLTSLITGSSSGEAAPPATDPCGSVPTNDTPDKAILVTHDVPSTGRYCRSRGGPARAWFRLNGSFTNRARIKLQVTFERGRQAGDLDFSVGVLNGNSVAGTVVSGLCSNPAGQREECVTEISVQPGTPVTAVYAVAVPANQDVEAEAYQVILSHL